MGCGGSKSSGGPSGPMSPDRVRQPKERPVRPSNPPTPGRAIHIKSNEGPGRASPGRILSYTDQKTKEYDFLHRIVKQTRHNFIDVDSARGGLHEADAQEREHRYTKALQEQGWGDVESGSWGFMDIPMSIEGQGQPLSTEGIILRLGEISTLESDFEMVYRAAHAVTASMAGLQVQESGKVVLTFDELSTL